MIREEFSRPRSARSAGFSLIEVLAVVAVIGVMVGIGTFFVGARQTAGEIKLRQDVSTLNKAVKVYLASGGEIGVDWDVADVLRALKQRAASEEGKRVVGMSGSLIDLRMGIALESEQEAGSGREKALWLQGERRFVVSKKNRVGVREFVLHEQFIPKEVGRDGRETAVLYAKESSWVWDYQDRSNDRPAPTGTPKTGEVPYPDPPVPPAPVALALLPPTFSHTEGEYTYTDFDLPVTMEAAKNVPGTYEIFYNVDGGAFQIYEGGSVSVPRGSRLMAFAKSVDPDRFTDSSSTTATYDVEPFKLEPPTITSDYAFFDDAEHPRIVVSIDESNGSDLPKVTRYRVEGGPWKEYGGSFALDAADYPNGAMIEAVVSGLEPWVVESDPANKLLKYKLNPPEFVVTSEEDVEAAVAITDPNDPAISETRFRWADLPSASYGSESVYGAELFYKGEDHPDGVRIASRSVSQSERYIDSDEVAIDVFLVDPDNWEIDGLADGEFSDAEGGSDLVVGYDNEGSMFSWGEGLAPTYLPSTVGFEGASFSGVEPGEVFKVGDITYFNGTISGGTGAEAVAFEVEIGFNNDRSVKFQIPVELVNVPNGGEGTLPEDAADYLRIPNDGIVQDIRLYGEDYRVAIAFGGSTETGGETSLTEFHVWEDNTATAEVFAAILEQNASTNGVLGWMNAHIKQLNGAGGSSNGNGNTKP